MRVFVWPIFFFAVCARSAFGVWFESNTYLRTGLAAHREQIHACDATLLLRYYEATGELTPGYTYSDEYQNLGNDSMAELMRAIYRGRTAPNPADARAARLQLADGYRTTMVLHGFDALANAAGVEAFEVHDGIVTSLAINPGKKVNLSKVPYQLLQGVSYLELRRETRPRFAEERIAIAHLEEMGLFERLHQLELGRLHPRTDALVLNKSLPNVTRLCLDPRRTLAPFRERLDRLERIDLRLDSSGRHTPPLARDNLLAFLNALAERRTPLPLRDLRFSTSLVAHEGTITRLTQEEAAALVRAFQSPALSRLERFDLEWVLPAEFDTMPLVASSTFQRLRHLGVRSFRQPNMKLLLAALDHEHLQSLEAYGSIPHTFFTRYGGSELHLHLKRLVFARQSSVVFYPSGSGGGGVTNRRPIAVFASSVLDSSPSKLQQMDFRGFYAYVALSDPGITHLLRRANAFPDLIEFRGVIPITGVGARSPFTPLAGEKTLHRLRELDLQWPRIANTDVPLEDADYVASVVAFLRSKSARSLTQLGLPLQFLEVPEILGALEDPNVLPNLYLLRFTFDEFFDRDVMTNNLTRRTSVQRYLQTKIDRGLLVVLEHQPH